MILTRVITGKMCCDDEMIVFAKKPKEADNNVSDFFNVNTSATILVDNIHDNDNGHDYMIIIIVMIIIIIIVIIIGPELYLICTNHDDGDNNDE